MAVLTIGRHGADRNAGGAVRWLREALVSLRTPDADEPPPVLTEHERIMQHVYRLTGRHHGARPDHAEVEADIMRRALWG